MRRNTSAKIGGLEQNTYDKKWGTLSDYLPYLAGTDKVLLYDSQTDSYLPVAVRKERAFLRMGSMPVEAEEKLRQFISAVGNSIKIPERLKHAKHSKKQLINIGVKTGN